MTHTPETPQDCKSKTVRGTRPEGQLAQRSEDTRPKGQPAQKSESSRAMQEKQSRQIEPVIPKIKWNEDSIELNGKVHKLPITKEYILKEYSDVFKGIGTLPGAHTTLDWRNSTDWFSIPPGQYQLPCKMHTKQN